MTTAFKNIALDLLVKVFPHCYPPGKDLQIDDIVPDIGHNSRGEVLDIRPQGKHHRRGRSPAHNDRRGTSLLMY